MLLLLLIVSLMAELALYIPMLWPLRKYYSILLIAASGVILPLVAWQYAGVVSVALVVLGVFRVINLLRIVLGRLHEKQLYNRAMRSSAYLVLLSTGGVAILNSRLHHFAGWDFLYAVMALQLMSALTILLITIRNILKTRHEPGQQYFSDKELPSITVAIPARNETPDLEECIRALLASDYPKLEIIVLDDCSQDKTADVIKKFANSGVRFVQGREPDEQWLAKNNAYEKLAEEASGDYILFCGVDVRVGTKAIRQLVTTLLIRQKKMISVLPRRLMGTPSAAVIQPMRYWWELALPRRLFNRPPVLSTCWLIENDFLKQCGGFQAVRNNILPERYFARQAVRSDGYSFVRAHDELDVQTLKRVEAQRETAIRMRYPQMQHRPELVLAVSTGMLSLLLGPFIMLFVSLFFEIGPAVGWSLMTCSLLIATHVLIVWVSNPINIPVAIFNYPIVVLTELVLTYESMLKYEFSVVEWRGRNICIPVMEAIPRLPKA